MEHSDDEIHYPTVGDVVSIHDNIIEEEPDSEPGIEDEDRIEFVLEYIEHGHFGSVPRTIHEKAFHLMRLLAANHLFVDGNKRTALNTTVVFYALNGVRLEYGEDVRSILKLFSVREDLLDQTATVDYLSERTNYLESTELVDVFDNRTLLDIEVNQCDPNS
ncbi:type II toxin-antitoxin system death-on-curing family toxin [Halorussus litoreus]|uniref:type II toxin-antitoxin system death-on-curing family toxin n=1 Tax=Halorussus litoreus TaxID=1710536 RepID=UPI000E2398A6|nr:type II toxin-antitoxin system death-on-curing family toxin [Halorussus litoreus]